MCVKYNRTRFICVSQEQQQTNDTYVEDNSDKQAASSR